MVNCFLSIRLPAARFPDLAMLLILHGVSNIIYWLFVLCSNLRAPVTISISAYFLLEMGGRFSDTLILVPVCILVFEFGIAVDVMEYTL